MRLSAQLGASDSGSRYIAERRLVNAADTAVAFPCSYMDILYKTFCFQLVHVNSADGRVHQFDRRCVPTEVTNSECIDWWRTFHHCKHSSVCQCVLFPVIQPWLRLGCHSDHTELE